MWFIISSEIIKSTSVSLCHAQRSIPHLPFLLFPFCPLLPFLTQGSKNFCVTSTEVIGTVSGDFFHINRRRKTFLRLYDTWRELQCPSESIIHRFGWSRDWDKLWPLKWTIVIPHWTVVTFSVFRGKWLEVYVNDRQES